MKYNNRAEVERIGRAGVHSFKDKDNMVARQMASYWLYVDPTDKGYTPHALNDGFWEAWITLWMSQHVKPGAVCVDVGANFGFYTFFLAQHGCKVFAFDPSPLCISLLKQSNIANGTTDRVTVEHKAVTDGKEKEVKLWEVSGHMMNTTIHMNNAAPENFFTAKTTSLDKYFARKKEGKQIDFIKIDAEGSEQLIWNGMQKVLEANPRCIVLMEFVPDHYEKNGRPFLSELLSKRDVWYVDYAGREQRIVRPDFFESDTEPFRMLVLRRKRA
ncbi:MAG: FkbM family methyltransferase [Flavobacteriales bacterium]|nr:FkbM family methyltransferase [Flavobacteriales bacterium]